MPFAVVQKAVFLRKFMFPHVADPLSGMVETLMLSDRSSVTLCGKAQENNNGLHCLKGWSDCIPRCCENLFSLRETNVSARRGFSSRDSGHPNAFDRFGFPLCGNASGSYNKQQGLSYFGK